VVASSQPSYDVSVIVPTYNRAQLLSRALASLIDQRADDIRYEVLVVDNGSRDTTPDVVAHFYGSEPPIRYILEPRRGVSHARNTGAAAARAPILAFVDDDVEADPHWIAEIRRAFNRHPEIDCVGGRIQGRWPEGCPSWLTPLHWGAVALQAEKGISRCVDAEHASACLLTANFACRREALEAVAGFSPEFLRDEDREFQLRLWTAGKRGLYVPEIIVTTVVTSERTTKAYHRRFHVRVGGSHARMRYRDRIDRHGRLVPEPECRVTIFGTPGYIYRELLGHLFQWVWLAATCHWNRAFYHETRVLYFSNYVWTRYRQQLRPVRTLHVELRRLASSLVLTRLRRHTNA
jgi:glycosyltransferase involved in cell wall biosynthesis